MEEWHTLHQAALGNLDYDKFNETRLMLLLHMMIFKCGDHVRMWPILLWVALLTLLTWLRWSIPMALMALLKGAQ